MLHIERLLIRNRNLFVPTILHHSKMRTICEGERSNVRSAPKGAKDKIPLGINYGPVCPDLTSPTGGKDKDDDGGIVLKRAIVPGKCRMCFIPEEWFVFLRPMTGVSGPYILMIGLGNYLVSKEIYVMEHEYYMCLSLFVMGYYVTTRYGQIIGIALDKGVDAIANELEESRQNQVDGITTQIKNAKTTIWRAEGQKELIEAKKENVAIQLEAVFRERQMMVYKGVQRQMEYHVKRHWISRRIKHKWMVQWMLEQVYKGITPEFKKHVMEIAIRDLTVLADKYEASQANK